MQGTLTEGCRCWKEEPKFRLGRVKGLADGNILWAFQQKHLELLLESGAIGRVWARIKFRIYQDMGTR